jgi:hypothetical protein
MAYGITNVNKKATAGNGLGPRTRIISLSGTNITQAQLDELVQDLGNGGVAGTNDAVTIAGISAFTAGVTDVVYMAVQGTGVLTPAADYAGVTGITMALVTTFDQA